MYDRRRDGFVAPTDAPWLDDEGKVAFAAALANASSYLEYGAGGSTILADRRGIPALSVESDPYYADAVRSRLTSGRVELLNPKLGLIGRFGTPIFPTRSKARRYIEAPFSRDHFPDFILVDGRFRVACALASAKRAHQSAGRAILMFDDYARRHWYHRVEEHLGKPRMHGRAAFFEIGSKDVPGPVIDHAAQDYR
jgi:hypothetical protein